MMHPISDDLAPGDLFTFEKWTYFNIGDASNKFNWRQECVINATIIWSSKQYRHVPLAGLSIVIERQFNVLGEKTLTWISNNGLYSVNSSDLLKYAYVMYIVKKIL